MVACSCIGDSSHVRGAVELVQQAITKARVLLLRLEQVEVISRIAVSTEAHMEDNNVTDMKTVDRPWWSHDFKHKAETGDGGE